LNNRTEELAEVVKDWANAELAGDTDFLRAALADDFVGVGPRGFALTREEWLDRHESGALKYGSFALDGLSVQLYGDAAVASCRQDADGLYEDDNGRYDIHERFRATLVLVRQRGRWRLASLQLSPFLGRP
jgi:ketosteroid isomerase-like protein